MQHSLHMPAATLTDRARRPTTGDEHIAPSPLPRAARDTAVPNVRTWQGLFGPAGLGAAEQLALASVARQRTVPAGGTVFDRGEPATALVLAASGDVALGWRGADGVFHIERPVRGPAWLDQSAAWLNEPHAMDARACSEVVVVELPCDAMHELLASQPGLAQQLLTSLAHEVHGLTMNTHELMHKDAPARFAAWLLQRIPAAEWGARTVRVQLGERKRDIASQLAITPETLSRLMRSLSRQGLISVAGYTVQVLDFAALQKLAETG